MDLYRKAEKITLGSEINGPFKGFLLIPTNTTTTSASIGINDATGAGLTLAYVDGLLAKNSQTVVPVAGNKITADSTATNVDIFKLIELTFSYCHSRFNSCDISS